MTTSGGDAVAYAAEEGIEWTTRITPHRGWLDWRLGKLWRYRDLISIFVWLDFVSLYRQTILRPAWHIVQPLLTSLTFTSFFSRVAKPFDRRNAALDFLPRRNGGLGTFCKRPNKNGQHLRRRLQPAMGVIQLVKPSAAGHATRPGDPGY